MTDDQPDRLIIACAVSRVDRFGDGCRLRLELAIAEELAARRRCDLHEGENALPLRMGLEQSVDGAKTVQNPLGVVEPLDTDAELGIRRQAKPFAHGRAARLHGSLPLERL